MKRVALVAIFALAATALHLATRRREKPLPAWATELREKANEPAILTEPLSPSLREGAAARAYAICFDLAKNPDLPAHCRVSSAFVFTTTSCASISYRGLGATYHEACALSCDDGCFVLDGLFSRTTTCDEWHGALGRGCTFELREGVRFGPDDADGAPDEIERARAQEEIDRLRR